MALTMIKPTGLVLTFTLAACGGPPDQEQTQQLSPETTIPVDYLVNEDVIFEVETIDETDWVIQFTDPDPIIRQEAIDLLVESDDLTHVELLELALSDPHPGVREAAEEALEDLGVSLEDEPL